MIYRKDKDTIVIELKYFYEEDIVNISKALLFCIRNLDQSCPFYDDIQQALRIVEELIPSPSQIDLSILPS